MEFLLKILVLYCNFELFFRLKLNYDFYVFLYRISSVFSHEDMKVRLSQYELTDQFDMIKEGNDALHERIVSVFSLVNDN